MITDTRAAELCCAIYGKNGLSHPVEFFHTDPGNDDGICWAVAREQDTDVIILRGSVTPEDWFNDVQAFPYMSRRMGHVHKGFYLGMENAWSDMRKVLRPGAPIAVTGHSLGAARSAILVGIMICDGVTPKARIAFGEPKPGYAELGLLINCVPSRSYRNGKGEAHDVVTDLPFTIPRIGLHYIHPSPLILLDSTPDPNDGSGMFVYHHIDLYLRSLPREQ